MIFIIQLLMPKDVPFVAPLEDFSFVRVSSDAAVRPTPSERCRRPRRRSSAQRPSLASRGSPQARRWRAGGRGIQEAPPPGSRHPSIAGLDAGPLNSQPRLRATRGWRVRGRRHLAARSRRHTRALGQQAGRRATPSAELEVDPPAGAARSKTPCQCPSSFRVPLSRRAWRLWAARRPQGVDWASCAPSLCVGVVARASSLHGRRSPCV